MRILSSIIALAAASGIFASAQLVERNPFDDVCGQVHAVLEVPNKGKTIKIGSINACLCVSAIPSFVDTNALALAASAFIGKAQVIAIIKKMVNSCSGHKQCHFPDHAVPACKPGNPCFFTCKDGFEASPAGSFPTKCVCPKGTVECNGKCIKGRICPSGHGKRDVTAWGRDLRCPRGLTACGVYGRSARAWECVDTMHDLESCGGCTVAVHPSHSDELGVDCTSLRGVSDVSCIKGACVIHRCMSGFDVHPDGSKCVYSEDKDPQILAAQYGLEHVPI